MPQGYDNTNSGALFRNDRKQAEKQPDYKGELDVAGNQYWVSAWLKTSGQGVKYLSLAVTPKDAQKQQPPAQTPHQAAQQKGRDAFDAAGQDDDDLTIPF